MIKLIRRNQRVFLAGLTILSMLVFLVQRGSNGQDSSSDKLYGTIYGKKIFTSELAEKRAELQALSHSVRFESQGESRSMMDVLFGPEVAQAIAAKPEWFLLLCREADAANIQVNRDEVGTIMANYAKDLDPDSDLYTAARAGVVDVYKIFLRFQQVQNAFKISKPMLDNMLVKFGESLQLNMVQLSASDLLTKVPPPTTQQAQDQFTAFAATAPHKPTPTTNPFGFGYKLPLRSKMQYLRVSTDEINDAVITGKGPYEWEVSARKYFLNHSGEFTRPATTAPSTAPSTQPAIQLSFDDARPLVLKTIRDPLVKTLIDEVRSYLNATITSDYQTYLQFTTSGKGGDEPDSSLGVRYSSFSYLVKLSDAVKARFKVSTNGTETPDYLSTQQIGDIPGVGTAALTRFVDTQAMAYLDSQDKKDPAANAILMKPSPAFLASEDQTKVTGMIFARLSGVYPSQAPIDITGIRSQVESDYRYAQAYKLAQAEAAALAVAAKQGNLAIAAIATGKSIIPVQGDNAISISSNDVKGLYPPLGDSAPSFMKQAFDLMGTYDPKKNPHPVQTIELPEQGRLFVVQMTDLTAGWDAESFFRMSQESAAEAFGYQDRGMREAWYDYDAVVKRTGFKLEK